MRQKDLIKNLDYDELVELFLSFGEKEYRARQLLTWLYERNIESFNEITVFSKTLRQKLIDAFEVHALELEDREISSIDGTEKFLFRTRDGNFIESVLLRNDGSDEGRLTVCISSQVGCAMGCTFCETGKIGFLRHLEPGEIVDQINQVRRITGLVNNNVVFMGMGEPLHNYENVMKSAAIMNYSYGFHLSVRKITISTSGLIPGIERYIDEQQPYNLALSLNDSDPLLRAKTMPVEKRYPFAGIVALLERKFPVSRNRLTIEYVMRKDNISRDDAKRIKKLVRNLRIKLNLIPLNSHRPEEIPSPEEVDAFRSDLEIMNVPVSVRKSLGYDISGACGQLSGKKYRHAG